MTDNAMDFHRFHAVDETEQELCNEFTKWADDQGLPQMSADELLHENITTEQRKYLTAFIGRWELVIDAP